MSLLTPRDYFKPFDYDWAFEFYLRQNAMHWIISEVPLSEDIIDWNRKLKPSEKNLLTQLFRFFTQSDADIARGYVERYLPKFQHPEVRMMLLSFAAMEAIHQHAYSALIDTLGLPDSEYRAFQSYSEMRAKHEFMFESPVTKNIGDLLVDLATFSAFGEGLQLFSSFAVLMSFQKRGLLKGMTTLTEYSLRDESLHVEGMLKLFHTLVEEHPKAWTDEIKKRVYDTCRTMVALEDKFIDLMFAEGDLDGLSAKETKRYIRYIADRRLLQLGLKPNYRVKDNPLPWLDWIMNAPTHTNFFEGKSTEYGKGAIEGWGDAFGFLTPKQVDEPVSFCSLPSTISTDVGERTANGTRYRVYTMPGCPHCERAINALEERNLPYESVLVEDPVERQRLKDVLNNDWKTFPLVFKLDIDSAAELSFIGGADALLVALVNDANRV